MDDTLKDSWDNSQDPISKQIKKRIEKIGDRYHCNDNISCYTLVASRDMINF